MSNSNNRDYNDRNNVTKNNEQQNEEARVPYSIEIVPSNFEDRATGLCDQMTSYELLSIANSIFSAGFEDFEGTKMVVDNYGNPVIEAWFNHRITETEDSVVGFSQNIDGNKYKNKTTARVMRQNNLYRNGNTYHITQDAKDVFAQYIMPSFKGKNGKVNWDAICGDFVNPSTNGFGYGNREVLSKIFAISPVEILKAKYGTKNEKGENVQYSVTVLSSLPSGQAGFLLSVNQINEVQFDRALRNAGVVNSNGLGIYKN